MEDCSGNGDVKCNKRLKCRGSWGSGLKQQSQNELVLQMDAELGRMHSYLRGLNEPTEARHKAVPVRSSVSNAAAPRHSALRLRLVKYPRCVALR